MGASCAMNVMRFIVAPRFQNRRSHARRRPPGCDPAPGVNKGEPVISQLPLPHSGSCLKAQVMHANANIKAGKSRQKS